MARILYLMHVDWGWIRQRPQEIAVGLSQRGHEVRVLFLPSYTGEVDRGDRTTDSAVKRNSLWSLPLRRLSVIRRVNRVAQRLQVTLVSRRFKPDHVWITGPELVPLIPRNGARLVYDCMDLAEGFATSSSDREAIRHDEATVCRQADVVLCSSNVLASHVMQRYGREPEVVRNAYWVPHPELAEDPETPTEPRRRLLYIGTVAGWFDFDLCLTALRRRPELEIHLVGPLDVALPTHPRLVYLGVKRKDELHHIAAEYDGLVMPFVVNDLVRAVDPVKLYEYISMRRPVLVVHYPELEYFAGLVHTYSGQKSFERLLDRMQEDPMALLPPREEARRFLLSNTWSVRCAQIDEQLGALGG